jgi:serine/threonine-protein kinase
MTARADGADPRLDELLLRWEELHEQGRTLTPDELCSTCPELAPELARRIALLGKLDPLLGKIQTTGDVPAPAAPARAESRQSATVHAEYRDLRFHAEGALGQIFLARNAELNRDEALKFIQPGRDRDAISLRRFLQEVEVTGRLEHPGIVPIYGLGSDPSGAPCYAMRLIRGETLQEAIDAFHAAERPGRDPSERSLAQRDLLTRFVAVCNTVAYAHSRGILHRDLKPRNVMLGRFDETLVVDWGLAKPYERDLDSAADSDEDAVTPSSGSGSDTPTVGVVGTPAYMSPEQALARWDQVGPASDIFGLGAILYAILSSRPPYQSIHRGELLDKAQRCEFPRPRQLNPEVSPALEAICQKAMAALPEGRYATAQDLAADVKRWLADEPVEAYAEPLKHRARRWMRRHRTLVTSTAAVLVFGVIALAGFAGALAGQNRELDRLRQRAERREALAIGAVRKFRDVIHAHAELKGRPELDSLRKALLTEPQEFFRQLRDQLQSDRDSRPDALEKLAAAAFGLADTTEEIGNIDDSIASHAEALTIRKRLAVDHPTVARYRADLAQSYHNLGHLLDVAGRPAEAFDLLRQGLEISERLVNDHPDVSRYQVDQAAIHNFMGNALRDTNRTAEALESYQRAVEIQKRLVNDYPGAALYQSGLADTHLLIAYLLGVTGRAAEALGSHRQGLQIREQLVRAYPSLAGYQDRLALSLFYVGDLLEQQRQPALALESIERALPIRQRLADENPTVTEYQRHLAEVLDYMGYLQGLLDRSDEALESHRRAIATYDRLVRANPGVPAFHRGLALAHFHVGYLLGVLGRSDEALGAHGRAQEIFERLARENPSVPTYQNDVGDTLNYVAEIEIRQGKWHEARKRLDAAIERQRAALSLSPLQSPYQRALRLDLFNLAKVYQALNQPTDALRVIRELAKLSRDDPTHLYGVACAQALCVPLVHREQQRALADEAVQTLKQAILAGWSDAGWASRDPDLAPLHARTDFRRLIVDLFDRTFPAEPFAP